MNKAQIRKLREIKKDLVTWTGSISILCTVVSLAAIAISVKALKGSNVDFLKDCKTLTMPSLIGLTQEECRQLPEYGDMQISFELVHSSSHKAGEIFYQSVDAGYSITNNQTINVKVSNGAQKVQIPNTVGLNVNDAKQALNELGLNYTVVYTRSNDNGFIESNELKIPAQTVIKTEPAQFDVINDGDTVTLYVERPYVESQKTVPSNLYGKTWNEAKELMAKAGITNYKIFYIASDGAYGRVVSVWPKGKVTPDQTIYIKVSGGPTYGM